MSTLHHIHNTLLLTPACWKYNNTHAHTHIHTVTVMQNLWPWYFFLLWTTHLEPSPSPTRLQALFNPIRNWKLSSSHSTSAPVNVNTQILLQYVCVHVRVCVCVCLYVCAVSCSDVHTVWINFCLFAASHKFIIVKLILYVNCINRICSTGQVYSIE